MKSRRWVSLAPLGIGQQKPFHYGEMMRVAWENRAELPFAWRILRDGVCDGCALGTSGLHDWTIPGVHLCMVRLELLRLNTAPALDLRRLDDASALSHLSSADLRELGRLPEPLIRRRGDRGFRAIAWDEALGLIAAKVRETDPRRVACYLTSRGITNEVYYVAQKAMRAIGSNHVDNSARLCHAASTAAMKTTLGRVPSSSSSSDRLFVSTRRGKQFNSMVQRDIDPLTGAARAAVLISADDAARLGVTDGAAIELCSPHGAFAGRVHIAPMRPGNLEVHWPEGNVLLSGTRRDPASLEPDYNIEVTVRVRTSAREESIVVPPPC